MFVLLLVLFLVLPIAELYIIVQVSGELGTLNTIALLIGVSVVGAWLVRREGLSALARAQADLARGKVPTKTLVDGVLILFAGALLLTPGFLTDALGVAMLLPPIRAVVRTVLMARYSAKALQMAAGGVRRRGFGSSFTVINLDGFEPSGFGDPGPRRRDRIDDDVIDVDGEEVSPDRRALREADPSTDGDS